MAFYRLDRFNGLGRFGVTMMRSEGSQLAAQQAPETQSLAYTKGAYLESRMTLSPYLTNIVATATAPAKTEQQKAEEELAALQKAVQEAETAAVVEETLDLGEPTKTPWLLYGGIGAGALVLIGGVLFLTKKKGKKVAGYRRRRRRR